MQGKLIKMVEGYTVSLTGSIDDLYAISNKELAEDHQLHKLSLKNCQAIKRGYDLDDLAKKFAIKELADPNDYEHSIYASTIENTYMSGFLKALEIQGDKKFSENELKFNMLQLFYLEKNEGEEDAIFRERQLSFIEKSIQSLQQTEFDVEIEMESNLHIGEVVDESYPKDFPIEKPKLDKDGCLILRRKI